MRRAARRPAGRGVSMNDVARAAGVSGQTVSRVANGLENVTPETRERVHAAMRHLGYRPNSAARALRSGRFRAIGVIMLTLSSVGNSRTLEGIAAASMAAGYGIALMPVTRPTQGEVEGAVNRLNEQAVDGIILVLEAHLLDEGELVLPEDLPVVVVDAGGRHPHPVVDTDQTQGARLATEHLLGLGHHTVWHVSGPTESWSAVRRQDSWRQTLIDHDRPVPPVLVGDWSPACGHRHGRTLAADDTVTAVFCANDQTALGVLRALHEAGRRVPEDVSVVGFDDMIEAASFWPPLTTVHQSFDTVGAESVHTLLAAIEDRPHAVEQLVPTRLVVRRSTGPAPTSPGRPGPGR